MKLEVGKYPDFYKKRYQVIQEDLCTPFVGRKLELEMLWDTLCRHVNWKVTNRTLVSHRKMGKTSLLKRFFNVAFWEQDEVVVLYYSFKNTSK